MSLAVDMNSEGLKREQLIVVDLRKALLASLGEALVAMVLGPSILAPVALVVIPD